MENLSRGARRCFQTLQSFARKSGRAFPFQSTLAAELEVDIRTVRRYIRELRIAGWISVEKRQHSSALYTIQTGQNVRSGVLSEAKNVRSERSGPYITERLTTSDSSAEPPTHIKTETGYTYLNPVWQQWRDREQRIRRANNPAAYRAALERRQA